MLVCERGVEGNADAFHALDAGSTPAARSFSLLASEVMSRV